MGKFVSVLVCAFLGIFATVGVTLAWKQAEKVTGAQRVPAVILSKELHSHQSRDSDGHTSTVYRPDITYRCDFDGGQVVSEDVYPFTVSTGGKSGREAAKKVLAQYEIGQQVQAWFNPRDPGQTFLIREISFFPYVFILMPGAILAVLIAVFVRGDAEGAARIRKRGTVATAIMALVGAGCWKHYFGLAGDDTDDMVTPVMTVYFALTAIPFAVSLPKAGLSGRLKSALTLAGILAFVGIWLGLLGGGLVMFATGLFKSFGWMNESIGGPHWVKYTVPTLGGIGFLFGLVAKETTPDRSDDDPHNAETAEFDSPYADAGTNDGFSLGFETHD